MKRMSYYLFQEGEVKTPGNEEEGSTMIIATQSFSQIIFVKITDRPLLANNTHTHTRTVTRFMIIISTEEEKELITKTF